MCWRGKQYIYCCILPISLTFNYKIAIIVIENYAIIHEEYWVYFCFCLAMVGVIVKSLCCQLVWWIFCRNCFIKKQTLVSFFFGKLSSELVAIKRDPISRNYRVKYRVSVPPLGFHSFPPVSRQIFRKSNKVGNIEGDCTQRTISYTTLRVATRLVFESNPGLETQSKYSSFCGNIQVITPSHWLPSQMNLRSFVFCVKVTPSSRIRVHRRCEVQSKFMGGGGSSWSGAKAV